MKALQATTSKETFKTLVIFDGTERQSSLALLQQYLERCVIDVGKNPVLAISWYSAHSAPQTLQKISNMMGGGAC